MPVSISKEISIKDKDGKISILTETDQIAESTDISAKCDSSRCASRHDGKTVEITWNIEAVKEKAEALPDGFFRLLSVIIDAKTQEQRIFCSAGCARDFLQYDYVAPLSPREEAVLQATNQQAELAKHRPKTNVVPFPTKAPVATVEAPPAPPINADVPFDPPVEQEVAPLVSIDTEGKTEEHPTPGLPGPALFSDKVAPFDPVDTAPVFTEREGA